MLVVVCLSAHCKYVNILSVCRIMFVCLSVLFRKAKHRECVCVCVCVCMCVCVCVHEQNKQHLLTFTSAGAEQILGILHTNPVENQIRESDHPMYSYHIYSKYSDFLHSTILDLKVQQILYHFLVYLKNGI